MSHPITGENRRFLSSTYRTLVYVRCPRRTFAPAVSSGRRLGRTVNAVLALNPLSATDLLSSFGTLGVLVVLFAETGLLIGFFLPGDSLLFTAGLLAATGAGRLHLSLPWVLLAAAAGALLGAQVGFLIGW